MFVSSILVRNPGGKIEKPRPGFEVGGTYEGGATSPSLVASTVIPGDRYAPASMSELRVITYLPPGLPAELLAALARDAPSR